MHAYQYDAWQRLVAVHRAVEVAVSGMGGGTPGTPVPPGFEAGLLVRTFTYDGVGRLIRTVSPWPSPELSGGEVRVERYFYDGVRRISEVVTDPMEGLALAMASGGEGLRTGSEPHRPRETRLQAPCPDRRQRHTAGRRARRRERPRRPVARPRGPDLTDFVGRSGFLA